MRTFLLLALVGISLPAWAIKFHCSKLDSGEAADISFNSELPLFTESSAHFNKDLISKTGACDQVFDYGSQCRINLIKQGESYSYGFRCDDVFGDLYFTPENGGAAQFRCFGEKVPDAYKDRIYRRCAISD